MHHPDGVLRTQDHCCKEEYEDGEDSHGANIHKDVGCWMLNVGLFQISALGTRHSELYLCTFLMKSSMIMDRDELNSSLKSLLAAMATEIESVEPQSRKRILLSGGICNHPDIYKYLEKAGGDVVWDDLCTGSRYFERQIDEALDPIEGLTEYYMSRPICPTKYLSPASRGENLLKLVKKHQAEGVVFLFLKFCDPHSFDYPYLKEYLDKNNIPSMLIEIEEKLPGEAQLLTRFESFIEMI